MKVKKAVSGGGPNLAPGLQCTHREIAFEQRDPLVACPRQPCNQAISAELHRMVLRLD